MDFWETTCRVRGATHSNGQHRNGGHSPTTSQTERPPEPGP